MVKNADEAMQNQGTLRIGADTVSVGEDSVLPLKERDYLRLYLQDEGPGIPEKDLQKIFDPYFSRKQMGNLKGQGLGLSICYSIIKDHGGLITVDSELGKGTSFSIYLPIIRETPEIQEVILESVPGRGKLLIMDDEESVRDIIGQILAHFGYQIHFAGDGAEAFEIYVSAMKAGAPFDLVIADLSVPKGMGGKELMVKLREIDPDVKAIISSGYSNDPVMENYLDFGFLGVVAKPYKVDELRNLVQEVLKEEHSQNTAGGSR